MYAACSIIQYSIFCVLSYHIRERSDLKPFLGLDSQNAYIKDKLGLIPVVRFAIVIQVIMFGKSGVFVYRVDQT